MCIFTIKILLENLKISLSELSVSGLATHRNDIISPLSGFVTHRSDVAFSMRLVNTGIELLSTKLLYNIFSIFYAIPLEF